MRCIRVPSSDDRSALDESVLGAHADQRRLYGIGAKTILCIGLWSNGEKPRGD
jgi:hypothetical protein